MSVNLEDLVARVRLDTSGLDRGLAAASSNVDRTTGQFADSAKRAAFALGAAGAVAAVKFTSDAAQLDTQMREVVTLFGETGKQASRSLDEISGGVRGLSDEFGIAQETLTGGLYQAISAGVPKENAFEFLKVASKTSIAGVTDVETAVDGLTTVINAFGLETADATAVSDSLFAAVAGGKTTIADLASNMSTIGPAAAAAKVPFTEVNAAIATLTAGGAATGEATTQLRAALVGLQKPSKELDGIFQGLGYTNAQTAIESEGLGFALDAVKDASKGNNGELQKLLGSSEAVAAANVIAGTGAAKFTAELKRQQGAAGAADKAFKVVNEGAARQFEILKTNLTNVGISVGQALLPALAKASAFLAENIGPALEKVTTFAAENKQSFIDTGRALLDVLVPAFKALTAIAAGIVSFWSSLPGPVQSSALQLGVAAIAVSKLSTAFTAFKTTAFVSSLLAAEGAAGRAAVATGKLATVARGAAGAAGLLALTSSLGEAADEGNSFGSVLKGAAGGAGIGAMLGPVGALVGAGVGGGLTALVGAFSDTTEEAKASRLELLKAQGFANAEDGARRLAEELLGVVNAYGKVGRAAVEASFTGEDGQLGEDIKTLRDLGVSMDTLTSAALGNAAAQELVNRRLTTELAPAEDTLAALKVRLDDAEDGLVSSYNAAGTLIENVNKISPEQVANLTAEYERTKTKVENLSAAQSVFGNRITETSGAISEHDAIVASLTRKLGIQVEQYNRFPRRVRTDLEANGLPQIGADAVRLIARYKELQSFRNIKAVVSAPGAKLSEKQIDDLRKAYDLTPKQVRTLLRLEGLANVKSDAREGRNAIEGIGKTKVSDDWRRDLVEVVDDGKRKARAGKEETNKSLRQVGDVQANTAPFNSSLNQGVNKAKSTASSGGREVGENLGSGMYAGVNSWASRIANEAARIVTSAKNAANAAARAKSPSREFMQVGDNMGRGMFVGIKATTGINARAAADVVDKTLTAAEEKAKERGEAITKATEQIGKLFAKSFVQGVDGARDGVVSRFDSLLTEINVLHDKRLTSLVKGVRGRLLDVSKAFEKAHADTVKARDDLRTLVDEARTYSASIVDAFSETGNVTAFNPSKDAEGNDLPLVFADIESGMQTAADQADAFRVAINALIDAGLNQDSLNDLIQKGPSSGLVAAQAILAQGEAAVERVNKLQEVITSVGEQVAAEATSSMYDAGIATAQGLIKGLESAEDAIAKQMRRIARVMIREIRDELQIKSPSVVFEKIGTFSGDGLVKGLDGMQSKVAAAGARMSTAAVSDGPRFPVGAIASANAAVAGVASPVGQVAPPEVRVFIGERELTDIVRVEVGGTLAPLTRMARQGAI